MRSQTRGATAIIASPAGAAITFCDAVTTTSKPQSSMRNSVAPSPLTESTIV